tara:strand:- start:139 stop:633 length:495 start_codon:yes stop_codon:yes gene_type:complete
MSTKKSKDSLVNTSSGVMRLEWADKNKSRMRRVDQRNIDRYMLDGKINSEQHGAANWYYNLSSMAQASPHVVSQIGKMRVGTSKPVISNKQAEARLVLGRVESFVKKNTSHDYLSVMRNVVVYDESMREQQRKYGGNVRRQGMSMLRDALDELYKVMGKYAKYI